MQRSEVANLFTYHPPMTSGRADQHREIDQRTREFALWLYDTLPASAETTLAIRALHIARMHANTAIAVHGAPV